ncbi:LysR family transcriptional regulator [Poriferisphaera sp. WC338]|uniref:LysR family transcriptional regulator n=1 Tax=Poriferisphaera sp. WC338 TaxID=3425129 RepID=UPI003D8167A3
MQTLRLFYDVARCHSFSQAANLHGITQSAASQRISQLEKRLGVTLIDRSVRPLALTDEGNTFLEGASCILDKYDRLAAKLASMKQDPIGTVRIAAIYSSGIELLGRIADQFHKEHPRVHIDIHYTKPDHVYREVREDVADFGILAYPQGWRKLGILPLREEVMAVVTNPSHPLASRSVVTPEDLSPYEMVTFDTDLPLGRKIRSFLKEHHATPRIAGSFDNIDTVKNAVAVTSTFSILPGRTVLRELEAGTLTLTELRPQMVRPMGVVYRKRHKHQDAAFSPATQQFIDYLLANAGPDTDLGQQFWASRQIKHAATPESLRI